MGRWALEMRSCHGDGEYRVEDGRIRLLNLSNVGSA